MTQTKFVKLPLICLISIISIFTASADDTFVKVTNTDDLQGGGVYLLVYESTSVGSTKYAYFPISFNSNGYFETEHVTRNNDRCTIVNSNNPMVLVLKRDGNDYYTLQSIDGKYLSCKSSSGGIEFVSENSDDAKWSINITDDAYNPLTDIKNKNYNYYIMYSSNIIGAYNSYSGRSRICLYRKTETTQTISAQTSDNNYITTFGDMQDAFLESPALAYYATAIGDEITFKAIERTDAQIAYKTTNGTYIPKNTGTLIRSTSPEIKIHAVPANNCEALPYTNYLRVSDGTCPTDNNTSFYKLTYSDSNHNPETIGFYYGEENGAAFAIGTGKAYLAIPNNAGIRALQSLQLAFEEENTTGGIKETLYSSKEFPVYNITGQRVNIIRTNGLIIRNGKKYLLP